MNESQFLKSIVAILDDVAVFWADTLQLYAFRPNTVNSVMTGIDEFFTTDSQLFSALNVSLKAKKYSLLNP